MSSGSEAQKAIDALNGTQLDGRTLTVNEAKPREERPRGGGGGYGRDRGPREMFTATCSSCGKDAQVPFRPTSGKPVYCSDCFRSQRGGSSY